MAVQDAHNPELIKILVLQAVQFCYPNEVEHFQYPPRPYATNDEFAFSRFRPDLCALLEAKADGTVQAAAKKRAATATRPTRSDIAEPQEKKRKKSALRVPRKS